MSLLLIVASVAGVFYYSTQNQTNSRTENEVASLAKEFGRLANLPGSEEPFVYTLKDVDHHGDID